MWTCSLCEGDWSNRTLHGLLKGVRGYRLKMTDHPHQASSDEADPEKESTPAGVVGDLEEEAHDAGASTEPPEKK